MTSTIHISFYYLWYNNFSFYWAFVHFVSLTIRYKFYKFLINQQTYLEYITRQSVQVYELRTVYFTEQYQQQGILFCQLLV